jgi:hypothetical protein
MISHMRKVTTIRLFRPTPRSAQNPSLLVEKGLVDPAALDVIVDAHERKVGPRNGARVIARAWVAPGYK